MKKFSVFAGIALALAFTIVVGLPQTNVFADNQQLPYKASGTEHVLLEEPHPDCGPGRLKVDIEGSGQGTHTGKYKIVRHHCFNLSTFAIEDGYFEQTAANGDRLWGTYTGATTGVLEFAEDGSPLVVEIRSPWVIKGGTGRFADADGAGNAIGVFNTVVQQGNFAMDGWISYSISEQP
jgi:hypothetical protein